MKKPNFSNFNFVLFAAALCFLTIPLFGAEVGVLFGGLGLAVAFVPASASHIVAMNNTNNMSARESFQMAKKLFFKAFRNQFGAPGAGGDQACMNYVESLKLSQNEIRLEVNLATTSSNFVFGLTPNQQNTSGVNFLTENRLNLQDTFCVNEYGILVAQASGNNDTTFKMNTYGNTQIFAAADAAALDSTFYANGGFQIKCNNDVIVPYRGLWNHYYAPQTQQTAALGAASPKDQQRGAEDGFITAEPNVVLVGSKNYVPEIVLKAAMASAAANLRCILIFRGILAQNSTVVS